MRKIRDRIMLGLVSGVIAGIPPRISDKVANKLGLVDENYGQMAASLFLPEKNRNSNIGRLIGSGADNINNALVGVLITYVLSASGRDNAVTKGIGVSSVAWMMLYGVAGRKLGIYSKRKPLAPLLSFFDHALLGGLSGLLISNLGDDSLFPDSGKLEAGEKLPIVGSKPKYRIRRSYIEIK